MGRSSLQPRAAGFMDNTHVGWVHIAPSYAANVFCVVVDFLQNTAEAAARVFACLFLLGGALELLFHFLLSRDPDFQDSYAHSPGVNRRHSPICAVTFEACVGC